ncbi:MAG TPA: serine--tRNA ligase [Egibacteraceae bacterium]|nr:serine--tRNA ligase [Egibacteraceae bacterium]
MIDIRLARDDPEALASVLARRGVSRDVVDRLHHLDAQRRALITTADELRARQRQLGREVGAASSPQEREQLIAEVKEVSSKLEELQPAEAAVGDQLEQLLAVIPNLPHPDAPDGDSDEDAVEVDRFGKMPEFDFPARDHLEIGESRGMIDVARAAKVSGSRFAYLLRDAVLLELALIRYALDRATAAGFVPVIPPVLTRAEALFGTGFLPDSEDLLYEVPRDELYLSGTSEVALAGMHMDEILAAEDLPVRYAGLSTCFRREAGAYGKDTRGIFRVHQFDKVEMFSFVAPDQSEAEHQRLRDIQVDILAGLGLHGRVVDIAAGDLGASAARKFDIEVWLPGQGAYRELTSASNCTDYQARRLKCRYRADEGETVMVHTLNGTACAVGRTMIAVFETHQRADGTVAVPGVLQPYFGSEEMG